MLDGHEGFETGGVGGFFHGDGGGPHHLAVSEPGEGVLAISGEPGDEFAIGAALLPLEEAADLAAEDEGLHGEKRLDGRILDAGAFRTVLEHVVAVDRLEHGHVQRSEVGMNAVEQGRAVDEVQIGLDGGLGEHDEIGLYPPYVVAEVAHELARAAGPVVATARTIQMVIPEVVEGAAAQKVHVAAPNAVLPHKASEDVQALLLPYPRGRVHPDGLASVPLETHPVVGQDAGVIRRDEERHPVRWGHGSGPSEAHLLGLAQERVGPERLACLDGIHAQCGES